MWDVMMFNLRGGKDGMKRGRGGWGYICVDAIRGGEIDLDQTKQTH